MIAGLVIGLGALGIQQAAAFEMDFGVVGNSQLQFNAMNNPVTGPATFKLLPSTKNQPGKGFDFEINNVDGGSNNGSAVGDFGLLTGTFSIAPVTTTAPGNTHWYITTTGGTGPGNITDGSGSPGNPVIHSTRIAYQDFTETGAVSGVGTVQIWDGTGSSSHLTSANTLTGTATLSNITDEYRVTHANTAANTITSTTFLSDGITGTGPATTSGYTLNVTGISYGGSQLDLQELAAGNVTGGPGTGRAQFDLAWSFDNKKLVTLTQVGGGVNKVSYAGHIRSDAHPLPDGGMTLVLLGVALSGAALFRQRLVA